VVSPHEQRFTDLREARDERWWRTRPPVRTIQRAAAFVEDVGFALLFPSRGMELPSLWEAVSERSVDAAELEWGPDLERLWGWKDELPKRGLAWYGKFLRGKPSLLSPALLADLYPRSGDEDDFIRSGLSPDARRIAEVVLVGGPTSATDLRQILGAEGPRGRARTDKVLRELGRALVLTNFGVEQQAAGWPSAVLELTTRAFDVGSRRDSAARRLQATERFLDTMIAARPYELGNAFGWRADPARAALDQLVARGRAVRDGSEYRLS
jgi:hypothetical protein